MPRPRPVDYLQPDEEVLFQARRHPLSVVDELLAWGTLWLVACGATAYVMQVLWPEGWRPVGIPVIATATLLYLVIVVAKVWRVMTSRYVVTAERVYKTHGRLRFFLGMTTYDRVTDLHIKQSIVGRWRGFGTIRVETAGEGVALEGLEDPFGAKQAIERARSRFVTSLLEDVRARPSVGEEALLEPDLEEAQPIWMGRPSGAYFVSQFLWGGLLLLAGAGLLVSSLVQGTNPIFGGLMVIFGLSAAGSAWVQFRFTRYHLLPGGVVVTSGWLTRRRVETTFEKVTDVTTYQTLVGRILDFGHITINTAGSAAAPVVFKGLGDPEAVKHRIDEARREWRRRR